MRRHLSSGRQHIQQQKSELPTGMASGRRQICLLILGVHYFARLLAHLHVFRAPNKLSTLLSLIKYYLHSMYNSPHPLTPTIYRTGMLGQHIQMASDLSWWLCFEGLRIGKGWLTWQSYPLGPEWKWCLCQRWITVVLQRDLLASFCNHTLFCCSEASLHLI